MSAIDRASFIQWVNEFLAAENAGREHGRQVSEDTQLFADGLVSSLNFVRLILFLEQKLATTVSLSSFDSNSFKTVGTMYEAFADSVAKRGNVRNDGIGVAK